MKRSTSAVKISDPVAHANGLGRGPFRMETAPLAVWAPAPREEAPAGDDPFTDTDLPVNV